MTAPTPDELLDELELLLDEELELLDEELELDDELELLLDELEELFAPPFCPPQLHSRKSAHSKVASFTGFNPDLD